MSLSPWGVVLAGGDGTRLQTLTRELSGDSRPKQFCIFFGGESLLAGTRRRIGRTIPADRMLFAVVRHHEGFYRRELADIDPARIVVQPSNRGTTAAVIHSLLRLTALEEDTVAAFIPSSHHCSDEAQFQRALDNAFCIVRRHPALLVLLGATPDTAEGDYGWIEPAAALEPADADSLPVFRIKGLHEQPRAAAAAQLLQRGCLWNTSVVAGRTQTFLDVLESTVPDTLTTLQAAVAGGRRRADALHEALPSGDFWRDVLAQCTATLAVIRMENTGWHDLGTPERARALIRKTQAAGALRASGGFDAWLGSYRRRLEELCEHVPGKSVF